jgi:uncharacterized membrane protein
MFVPLAVPLLLLDADLQKCFKSTGSLLKAFLVGSMGTFIGTIIAYFLGTTLSIILSANLLQLIPILGSFFFVDTI